MIFKIPEYVGDATHDLTDWFVFKTDNTNNKENAIFSVTGDDRYKNVVNISIDIPYGETYYLIAHLYLSDGSILITKPLPIIHTDMDGRKVHGMSYGVEIPVISVISNAYASGGDIVIKTGKIRPKDNVMKQQAIVVTDEYGYILDFSMVDTYEYTIKRDVIINNTRTINVYASHQDYTSTNSLFGKITIKISDTIIGLLNDHAMPMYDYIPRFSNISSSVWSITISENGVNVYRGYSALIPKNTLKFDSVYRMTVTFRNDVDYTVEEFILYTTKSQSVDYLEVYEYNGFETIDEIYIPEMNSGYAEITASNLLAYIEDNLLVIRYFNNSSNPYKFELPYTIVGSFETINIADDIVYIKYKTENGMAVILVNAGLKYTAPAILSSIEITDAVNNDCVLTTDDTLVYLKKDEDSRLNIVSLDLTTRDSLILSVIPEEYTIEGDKQDEYVGLFDREYSLLQNEDELLIMNRNIGVFSFNLMNHDYKYVFSINDEDKGKSFFGFRLHGRKLMYVNINSIVYIYDFDTDETETQIIDNTTNLINMFAQKILFKTEEGVLTYN